MVQLKSVLDLTQRATFEFSFRRKKLSLGKKKKKTVHIIPLRVLFHYCCLYVSEWHRLWIIIFIPSEKGQQSNLSSGAR